jgi:uncharacterized Fe-S center protein
MGVLQMSEVYFASSRSTKWNHDYSLPAKLEELLNKLNLENRIKRGDYVAIKTHFGSPGAFRTVRPNFIKIIVDAVKRAGGKPFVTDTVRIKSLDYLDLANMNGISHGTVGAPVIIADGLLGGDGVVVDAGGSVGKIAVASAIYDADAMIVVSHFKGHIQSGFGGAFKNVSMGCICQRHREIGLKVSRGKLHHDEDKEMSWNADTCTLCEDCVEACPTFSLHREGDTIVRDETCWYCMRCARVCSTESMSGSVSQGKFQNYLVDSTRAILNTFEKDKVVYLNFNMEMQPECDCMATCDNPIAQDSGIYASDDIVAIDRASFENLRTGIPLPDSAAAGIDLKPGDDILKALYPQCEPEIALTELERQGLGYNDFELIEIQKRSE